ncbi:MAG: M56 family metallopeptidase [Planctomycetota bacterium]
MATDLLLAGWNDLVLHVGAWLATYALHSTLLIGGVWLATKVLRAGRESLRDVLWKVALVGGLATATLQVFIGVPPLLGTLALASQEGTSRELTPAPIDARPLQAREVLATALPPARSMRDSRSDQDEAASLAALHLAVPLSIRELLSFPREVWALDEGVARERASVPSGDSSQPLASRVTLEKSEGPGARRDPPGLPWMAVLTVFWGLGALLALARMGIAWRRLATLLAHREELHTGALPAILRRLCAQANVRRPPRLTSSPALTVPIALARSEICLPAKALSELTVEQQESMLAHELAHVVRRDPLWLVIGGLIERAFFFQPLNRLARRSWQDVSELLCDDWAVHHTGKGITLAKCLAVVASWADPSLRRLSVAGMAHRDSALVRRVQRLLNEDKIMVAKPARGLVALLCVGLLGLIAGAVPGAVPRTQSGDTPLQVKSVEDGTVDDLLVPRDAATLSLAEDDVIAQIKRAKQVSDPAARDRRLGVSLGTVDEALAAHLGVEPAEVLLITDVAKGSVAEKSGLEKFDIITHLNGEKGVTPEKLVEAIRGETAGDTLTLKVLRRGDPVVVEITFDAEPPPEKTVEPPRKRVKIVERDEDGDEIADIEIQTEELEAALEKMGEKLEALGERLGTSFEEFGEGLDEELQAVIEERGEELENALSRWAERFAKRMETRGETFGKRLEGRARRIEKLFEQPDADIDLKLKKLGPELEALCEELGPALSELLSDLGPELGGLGDELSPELSRKLSRLGTAIEAVTRDLDPVLQEIGPELRRVLESPELRGELAPMLKLVGPELQRTLEEELPRIEKEIERGLKNLEKLELGDLKKLRDLDLGKLRLGKLGKGEFRIGVGGGKVGEVQESEALEGLSQAMKQLEKELQRIGDDKAQAEVRSELEKAMKELERVLKGLDPEDAEPVKKPPSRKVRIL